jgi:hypothetical protein
MGNKAEASQEASLESAFHPDFCPQPSGQHSIPP